MLAVLLALSLGLLAAAFALAAPAGVQVLSFKQVQNEGAIFPNATAAGPTAGDILIASGNTGPNVVAANASSGQLDPAVGTGGTLPLPTSLPSGATAYSVMLSGNAIYATFFDPSASTIDLVSWNAQGQLNHGFGSGGLATVSSPSAMEQFFPGNCGICDAFPTTLAGGTLIVPALAGAGALTLTGVDPSTGSVGPTVTEPLPSGLSGLQGLRAAQQGPDGNLYVLGFGGSQVYYGIFNLPALAPVSQTAFADGDSARGEALAFLGNTAYLGVSSTTGSVTSAHLWSGPIGSTSMLTDGGVPGQVPGANQSLVGLNPGPAGTLLVTLLDQGQAGSASYVVPTDGSSFASGIPIGPNTLATTTAPAPGGNVDIAGYTGTGSDGHTSKTGTFIATVGEGTPSGPCEPVELDILKSVEPGGTVNRATVVEVRRSRHHYEVGLRRSGIQSVDYVIEVANTGQCDALDVGVTDRLPPDFLFASVVRRFGPPYDVVDEPTFPSVGGEVLIRIPVLGPGQTVEFAFLGSVFGRRTLTNTASLAAPGFAGKDSTVYLTPVPAPDAVIRSASATSVQGVTDAPSKGGRAVHRKRARGVVVKLVQVAIARMPSGRASSCAWLANRKGKFRRRACEEPLWLKATGTKQWRLSYKRLKPGRYVVLARALGRNGLSADTFGRGARDSGILRVR